MRLRQLFNIIVKVFGLFLLRDILYTATYLLKPIAQTLDLEFYEGAIGILIVSLIFLGLLIALAYMLLFKTDNFLDFLKLEPELENDKLNFEISSYNVMNIAIIILAGYLLIDEIPNFCSAVFKYYEATQNSKYFGNPRPSISELVVGGSKILIAFLIFGERRQIIKLATKSDRDYSLTENEQSEG